MKEYRALDKLEKSQEEVRPQRNINMSVIREVRGTNKNSVMSKGDYHVTARP